MKKLWGEKTICYCFNLLATAMYAVLFYYCLVITGKNSSDLGNEHIYFKRDSILGNVFCLFLIFLGVFLIGKIADKWLKDKRSRNILLGTACALATVFSFYWICACKTKPMADQVAVCIFANEFNDGNFRGLEEGEYIARYPQQLGMVTLLRDIFIVFGDNNYQVFRYLVAALIPLFVLSGYKIVEILTENSARAGLYYLLFALCCFPMYAYVNFVYSDLIASIFGTFGIWMYLSCRQKFSWVRLVLFGVSMGVMVVLRKNFLILIIALSIVMLVKLFSERKKRDLLLIAALAIGVAGFHLALWLGYRDVWPEEGSEAPPILYVVMGLNDDSGHSGWYNSYVWDTLVMSNNDSELAKAKAVEDLKAYILLFKDNPNYMMDFFVRKINAQWNAPMYQSVAMNNVVDGPLLPPADNLYEGGIFAKILEFSMKMYQLLMYGSILFLLVYRRKRLTQIDKYVLLIAVFGGFLFSVIWEAKTRYILPFLLMQIPYMAMGLNELSVYIEEKKTTTLIFHFRGQRACCVRQSCLSVRSLFAILNANCRKAFSSSGRSTVS